MGKENPEPTLSQQTTSGGGPTEGRGQEPLLVLVQGPRQGERFALTRERTTIGRAEGCELRLDSPVVSAEHARVVRSADGFSIEDLGSTNGVSVNGRRLGPDELQPLGHGDAITISDHVLLYVAHGSFSDAHGLGTIHVDAEGARKAAEELLAELDVERRPEDEER